MFEMEYKGGNTLVLVSKKETIVIDPRRSVIGMPDIDVDAAIELATEPRLAMNNESAKLVIDGPGEYGVSDFDIKGISAQRHLDSGDKPNASTIYRIEIGGVRLCLVGNIYEKINEDQLEAIGVVDILVLPVGGNGYTLDATGAAGIVHKIDPKVVVPVHYADKDIKYEVPQDSLETFVKELGAQVETVPKYKIKGSSSIPESLTVVEITRSK